MQEHIQLEVSLEIIMAEIANKMQELRNLKDESKTKLLENQLEDLIKLQEEAYKGDRKAVLKILNREF